MNKIFTFSINMHTIMMSFFMLVNLFCRYYETILMMHRIISAKKWKSIDSTCLCTFSEVQRTFHLQKKFVIGEAWEEI